MSETTPAVAYDEAADVLYVSFSREPAAVTREDGDGWLFRYDGAGNLIGCTILDFGAQVRAQGGAK